MVKDGDRVTCIKDMSSQYITFGKYYVVLRSILSRGNVYYELMNDRGHVGFFIDYNFISLSEHRREIIEDILC